MIYFFNFAYFHDLSFDFILGWHLTTVHSPSHPANQLSLVVVSHGLHGLYIPGDAGQTWSFNIFFQLG